MYLLLVFVNVLCVFIVQASKPVSYFRVDGSIAQLVERAGSGDSTTRTLQCTVVVPPNRSEPKGIVFGGTMQTGWRFEVRPVCSANSSIAQREVWPVAVSNRDYS